MGEWREGERRRKGKRGGDEKGGDGGETIFYLDRRLWYPV